MGHNLSVHHGTRNRGLIGENCVFPKHAQGYQHLVPRTWYELLFHLAPRRIAVIRVDNSPRTTKIPLPGGAMTTFNWPQSPGTARNTLLFLRLQIQQNGKRVYGKTAGHIIGWNGAITGVVMTETRVGMGSGRCVSKDIGLG